MRNRIKQLLNKEDGFTLVELLGVIVILGLILAIAVPGIGKIVDKARTETAANQEELILDAAQLYYLNGGTDDPVAVTTLISEKYLEDKNDLGKSTQTVSKTEAEAGKLEEKTN